MSDSDESSLIINDEYDNSNDNIEIIPSSKVEISNKNTNYLKANNENDINSKIIKNENNDKIKTEEKKSKDNIINTLMKNENINQESNRKINENGIQKLKRICLKN